MSTQASGKMLDIITDLLNLTRKMSKSANPDFLVEAIDRRGELMAEYDVLKAACPQSDIDAAKPKITKMINEIIELDKKASRTLTSLHQDAKLSLQNSNQNSKVLQYTNQAISSTGSYFDVKE